MSRVSRPTIEEFFFDTIEEIEDNCRLARVTLADVCEAHRVSRANISRWKKRIPATIAVMQALQTESRLRLAQREEARSADKKVHQSSPDATIERAKLSASRVLKEKRSIS